jgi:hypothetical protein
MAIQEIETLTSANKSIDNLTVNTNTNVIAKKSLTGIKLLGPLLNNTCSFFEINSYKSMITDRAINLSASSAILVKNNRTTKYTIV